MDIYQYAESINYIADYMDMNTGHIYKIQEYGKNLKINPDATISVYDDNGNYLGEVKRKEV